MPDKQSQLNEPFSLDNRSDKIIDDLKSNRGISFYRVASARLSRINIIISLFIFFFYGISLALILLPKDDTLVFSNKSGGSITITIDN